MTIDPGTSRKLADHRRATITNVSYHLDIMIPESHTDPIHGFNTISFDRARDAGDLVLDFKNTASNVRGVLIGGDNIQYEISNQHIIIDQSYLLEGKNEIEISFIAGDKALNRNEEYMYALFVPDNASTAFPCFDQPNIKAKYNLKLKVPSMMKAFANNSIKDVSSTGDFTSYEYNETMPISTYMSALGVGSFDPITKTIDGT